MLCYHLEVDAPLSFAKGHPMENHPMFTVAFRTLGCKLNACETAEMQEAARARGHEVVPWEVSATFRVINTCTVTGKTDRQCRHEIRRAKREHPECRVVVTGCFAQVSPEAVAALPEADVVLGNLDKQNLCDHLERLATEEAPAADGHVHVSSYRHGAPFAAGLISHFSGYTRAFLKVQNGCDHRCAYCIIPVARGPSRSMPLAMVVEQVRLLRAQGYRECVLTGIHIGAWGRDTREGGLAQLLLALAAESRVGDAFRVRLSSIEPMEITDEVIEVMREAGDVFADHFHVHLQSGCDSVLARMNRLYDSRAYGGRITALHDSFPDAAIGADVIVGFPGETDVEFERTLGFIRDLPLTYLHVFSYSDRPGTAASAMPDKVAPDVIKERGVRLRALGAAKSAAHRDHLAGRVFCALGLHRFDQEAGSGVLALTGNYQQVALPEGECAPNRFVRVRLIEQGAEGVWSGRRAGEGR